MWLGVLWAERGRGTEAPETRSDPGALPASRAQGAPRLPPRAGREHALTLSTKGHALRGTREGQWGPVCSVGTRGVRLGRGSPRPGEGTQGLGRGQCRGPPLWGPGRRPQPPAQLLPSGSKVGPEGGAWLLRGVGLLGMGWGAGGTPQSLALLASGWELPRSRHKCPARLHRRLFTRDTDHGGAQPSR